jgi:hypothetical protein
MPAFALLNRDPDDGVDEVGGGSNTNPESCPGSAATGGFAGVGVERVVAACWNTGEAVKVPSVVSGYSKYPGKCHAGWYTLKGNLLHHIYRSRNRRCPFPAMPDQNPREKRASRALAAPPLVSVLLQASQEESDLQRCPTIRNKARRNEEVRMGHSKRRGELR